MLFVCLFDLRLFGVVCYLFLFVSGKGCGLGLWHSLIFFLTFFFEGGGERGGGVGFGISITLLGVGFGISITLSYLHSIL